MNNSSLSLIFFSLYPLSFLLSLSALTLSLSFSRSPLSPSLFPSLALRSHPLSFLLSLSALTLSLSFSRSLPVSLSLFLFLINRELLFIVLCCVRVLIFILFSLYFLYFLSLLNLFAFLTNKERIVIQLRSIFYLETSPDLLL